MNARFIVAQTAPAGPDAQGTRTIKLVKPQGDQAITIALEGPVKLDFSGIKGQPELTTHFCTTDVAEAFLNDPYDWEGAKATHVCATEADMDGALTMQLMKLLYTPSEVKELSFPGARTLVPGIAEGMTLGGTALTPSARQRPLALRQREL